MILETLTRKMDQIKSVFDVAEIVNLQPDPKYITAYYEASRVGYSLLHSGTDMVHMGISNDNIFRHEDLYEPARFVARYIENVQGTGRVLELATGRGANSMFLANIYKQVKFTGIDISPAQLRIAERKAKKSPNYKPLYGDYHTLSFNDKTFDVAFVIEALCYSKEKERVFAEVKRVLKPNGVFILFDGYLDTERSKLDPIWQTAGILAEKGMAVPEIEPYEAVLQKAKTAGFSVVLSEDVSDRIMPTLRRFERMAGIYFSHPTLAHISQQIFPKPFLFNAVSAYLLPEIMEAGLGKYYITVLKRS